MFKTRYRLVFVLLLGLYSYLNILYTVGTKLFDFDISHIHLLATLTLVVFGIWELNRFVEAKADSIAKKLNNKVHPLIIIFVFSLVNVSLVSFISLEALYAVLQMPMQFNRVHFTLLMAFGFRVNLFLNCISAIVYYMDRLKKAQLEAEQLKKISIEAQFEALRNQINPHFLFNCFNVLSTLVYKDAAMSAKFIGQLSIVYRYLLFNQDKKMVPLKEELAFIEAYLFLLKIRFDENIHIDVNIAKEKEDAFIAPAVLQMLIENAIKHNVVSRKNPLHIHIEAQNGSIVVANSLREKEQKEESTQIGLKNIQNRYRFLTDREVVIEKNSDEFRVKIPLLELQK